MPRDSYDLLSDYLMAGLLRDLEEQLSRKK